MSMSTATVTSFADEEAIVMDVSRVATSYRAATYEAVPIAGVAVPPSTLPACRVRIRGWQVDHVDRPTGKLQAEVVTYSAADAEPISFDFANITEPETIGFVLPKVQRLDSGNVRRVEQSGSQVRSVLPDGTVALMTPIMLSGVYANVPTIEGQPNPASAVDLLRRMLNPPNQPTPMQLPKGAITSRESGGVVTVTANLPHWDEGWSKGQLQRLELAAAWMQDQVAENLGRCQTAKIHAVPIRDAKNDSGHNLTAFTATLEAEFSFKRN